jgi:hypothetical protein
MVAQGRDLDPVSLSNLKDRFPFFPLNVSTVKRKGYHRYIPSPLLDKNGIKLTGFVTDTTLDAFIPVYMVGFLFFTGDGLLRAFQGAQMTAVTFFFIDFVMEKRLTGARRTFLVPDVCLVLLPKI